MSTCITPRHARTCTSRSGGRCDCTPSYQASVWDKGAEKRIRKTFSTRSAAKQWRQDAIVAVRAGDLSAERGLTLRDATERWLDGMKAGHELMRSGEPYKPGSVVSYRQALELRVLPALGRHRVREVTARDVQALIDKLVQDGIDPGTIDTTFTPLRAFYRRALVRGEVNRNPTVGIIKPAVRSKVRRVTPPPRSRRA